VSFSVYLLHFPLIMSVSFRTAQFGQSLGMSYWAYAAISLASLFAVLFPLADVFYRFVDLPSMRLGDWLSNYIQGPRDAAASPQIAADRGVTRLMATKPLVAGAGERK